MKSSARAGTGAPGWYGKLPSLGDFAHRRLSARFIARWDEWLLTCLAATLAEAQDSAQAMPIAPVRFWLAPQLCDGQAMCGILVASLDRVGRRFPLTIATATDRTPPDDVGDHPWFEQTESTVLNAIDLRMTVDDFEAALAGLPPLTWTPTQGNRRNNVGSLWWSAATHAATSSGARAFPALPPVEAGVALFGAGLR
jgi:type VI secretion system protein ImpM